jgi:hypothetical protein
MWRRWVIGLDSGGLGTQQEPQARPPSQVCKGASLGHSSEQSPLPGQSITQGPAHTKLQSPLPVQLPVLPGPIAASHWPELVQATTQLSAQTNSQLPDPAHWSSQSLLQSIAQSPLAGQMQSLPEHSHSPSSHRTLGLAQPIANPSSDALIARNERTTNPRSIPDD